MRITVTYTEEADQEITLFLCGLPGTHEDVEAFAVVYLEQLKNDLIRTKGELPGAIRVQDSDPPRFFLPLLGGLWVEYTVQDERRWFWRATRTITILHFFARE